MTGFLLQDKQTSLLPLRLQKHKKYDLKKILFPEYDGTVISCSHRFFCLHQKEEEY